MYQFRNICTSSRRDDDGFGFPDLPISYSCSVYDDPILLSVPAIGNYAIGRCLVHCGI